MTKIKIIVEMNTQAAVALSVASVSVCSTVAYVLSRDHAPELVANVPATVAALPQSRQSADEQVPLGLASA